MPRNASTHRPNSPSHNSISMCELRTATAGPNAVASGIARGPAVALSATSAKVAPDPAALPGSPMRDFFTPPLSPVLASTDGSADARSILSSLCPPTAPTALCQVVRVPDGAEHTLVYMRSWMPALTPPGSPVGGGTPKSLPRVRFAEGTVVPHQQGSPLATLAENEPARILHNAVALHVPSVLPGSVGALVLGGATQDGVMLARLPAMHPMRQASSVPCAAAPVGSGGVKNGNRRTGNASDMVPRRRRDSELSCSSDEAGSPTCETFARGAAAAAAATNNSMDADAFRRLIVALMELAEDALQCRELVVCVDRADMAAIKALRYVGFSLVSPAVMAHDTSKYTLLACEL